MVKKILLVFMNFIIISFSFIMPNLLLRIEDLTREKEIFAKQRIERKIDVEAEKIYLVSFIHNIYEIKDKKFENNKTAVRFELVPITESKRNIAPTERFKNEVLKLVSNEIISETVNEITFGEYLQYQEEEHVFYPEFIVTTCSMPKENNEWIQVNIEEKTGKIISAEFSKNFLKTEIEIEKVLRNYAKYLDLDIIDDWKFENDNILKSEKAQLIIMLVEEGGAWMITIAPIEIYAEYVEIDNAINHEYEIIENSEKN